MENDNMDSQKDTKKPGGKEPNRSDSAVENMNDYEKLIDPGNEHTHDAKEEFEKEEKINLPNDTAGEGDEKQ